MTTANPDSHPHEHPLRGFDSSMERWLGADMRMLYGVGVPILMILGLIVVLALSPATWLVVAILLLEVGCLGLVTAGIIAMLNEPGDDEDDFVV